MKGSYNQLEKDPFDSLILFILFEGKSKDVDKSSTINYEEWRDEVSDL